ncbi:MAG TPA: hypothetical protein VMR98_02195, partial [Candidatus Polarisedimenticolaceae bacterium]|nr:hypothetical protein [Candidatus Polarisedimenticolaceae bacterium]
MSDKITLQLRSRDAVGKASQALRKAGNTPAIMYGHGTKPKAVSATAKELEQIYAQAGGNRIVALKIDDGKLNNGLIHDVQLDSRTGRIIHADFFLIRMDEKI